ncbi:MAG: hypothetical protein PHE68_05730 [Candidatus Peribacteraceae bacterium]|nr:hypothetical protein [Candidatus Peribacteraceae bacterium]MDD5074631.1 hypothetical protein [Candidatus Peribacteraceae bacterium]
MQHPTSLRSLSQNSLRPLVGVIVGFLILGTTVSRATAASSWNPTLLVNTESFSTIDDGDSTTNIELRFGETLGEKLYYNRSESRFQLTRDLFIQGNLTATGSLSVRGAMSGASLRVDGTSSLYGNLTASGSIEARGGLSGSTLNVSGTMTGSGNLAIEGTIGADGNIRTNAELTINADNGAADATLTFGNDAGVETLKFSDTTNRFEFSDDVNVTGDMTLTGGVQVGNVAPGTGTGAGTIRWTGTDYQGYDGTGWKSFTAAGKFVGTTVATTDGSVATGSLVGYQAANEICTHAFTGSHMCQVDELISTVDQNINSFSGKVNGWASMGAPGYTANANDCSGWTSGDAGYLGSWWEFSTDGGATIASGGGKGYLTNCSSPQPVTCCR